MNTKLLPLIAFFVFLFSFQAKAQYNPCPAGCDADPICVAEDMCFRFEYFGAKDQGDGTTMIKFRVINASRYAVNHISFELPGQGVKAISPSTSYMSRYNYSVKNTYQDSLIRFTGTNTANYRYDQADVFRYYVDTDLLNNGYNTTLMATATAGILTGTVVFNLEECGEDTPINPLPVELTAFNAAATNTGVALSWMTATEKENAYFSIQHSTDGRNFESAGYVEGHGTTNTAREYRFNHSQAAAGTNYYRLKQVDKDGKYEYSKVIAVSVKENAAALTMTLYPNPVTNGQLNVKLQKAMNSNEVARVEVQDLNGRTILSQEVKGGQEMNIDLNKHNLKAGLYLVNLKAGNQSTHQKIIVQ